MILNTDHLKRCIQTLQSSLVFYTQAAPDSIDQEIYRNAIVKGYELTQETSFKRAGKCLNFRGNSWQCSLDIRPCCDYCCVNICRMPKFRLTAAGSMATVMKPAILIWRSGIPLI